MKTIPSVITSSEFQRRPGDHIAAAQLGDVVFITIHDRKRSTVVLISRTEYERLKRIAGEEIEDGS